MSLTASVTVGISASHQQTTGIGTTTDYVNKSYATTLSSGTGANQADLIYTTTGNFTGSTSTAVNLSSSPVKDAFGTDIVMVRMKALVVANTATAESNNTLTVGAGTNPVTTYMSGTTPAIKVPAGGVLAITAPLATAFGVTATTADQITVASTSASGLTWEMTIIGASA